MDKLTIKQAAETLQVKPQALYNRIRRKSIEAVRIDEIWYIPQTEIERLRNGNSKRLETQVCEKCNVIQTRLQEKAEQVEYLQKRIDWLESQLEKHTILLAQEQSYRMKVLPKPVGWIRRIFGGGQSAEVAGGREV